MPQDGCAKGCGDRSVRVLRSPSGIAWVGEAAGGGKRRLEFVHARHPVVERRMEESGGGRFVPNSIWTRA